MTNNYFKDDLREKVISLLNSKRGMQTELAKSINKKSSYFSEIKRGNPVNAMHLKAIGLVVGGDAVLDLLGINKFVSDKKHVEDFIDTPRADRIIQQLATLERTAPTKYNKVEGYIDAQMDTSLKKPEGMQITLGDLGATSQINTQK